jgi:hypothetical protein
MFWSCVPPLEGFVGWVYSTTGNLEFFGCGRDCENPLHLSKGYHLGSGSLLWLREWMALPICWCAVHAGNGLYVNCGPVERWKTPDENYQLDHELVAACCWINSGIGVGNYPCVADGCPYWTWSNGSEHQFSLLQDDLSLRLPNSFKVKGTPYSWVYFTHWEDGSFSIAVDVLYSTIRFSSFWATFEITVPVIEDVEVSEDPSENPNSSLSVLPSPALCSVFAGGALGLGYSVTKLLS